jgi:peptidyl-prolyl cis-trans isomerase D
LRRRFLSPARFFEQGNDVMMEALRNGAKTWIAKLLLGLVMAVFAILGVSSMDISATMRGLFAQDLATVGGKAIPGEAFERELKQSLQQLSRQSGSNITVDEARKTGLDKQLLDRMIAQASIDAQGDRLGIHMGNKAVAIAVEQEKMFQDSKGQFDVNRFRSLLQQNGMSEQGYLAQENASITRNAMTGLAGDTITLPRTMIEALSRYRDETRDGRYVTFSVNAADVPAPTDAELKKQYETTPAAYTAPEYRSVVILKIDPTDLAAKIQVTQEEITAAYRQFKEEYFEPEKRDIIQVSFADVASAEKAKARIDAGEDIMKIAGELGQKEKDITFSGKVKTDFLDEKIATAAFTLAEGAVSAPVAGSLNTALLKAVKVVPARQPGQADVADQLKKRLQLQKAQEEIQSVYDGVEDARAQQTKFEDIGAKVGVPVITIPFVSATGTDKAGKPVALPAQDEVLKAVFASDVGLENDALQANEGYIWYDVREVIPSTLKPMDQVKEQVKADWAATKLRALAGDRAKAIVDRAGGNTKLETIATEVNGTIKTVTGLRRNATSEEFDGIATLALFSVPEKALTWALESDGKSARIIEVSKVTVPSSGASAGAKEVADLAKQGLGTDLLDGYLKSARASANVKMNEELWRQINGTAPAP